MDTLALTPFARKLLVYHAHYPEKIFYGDRILPGVMRRRNDLEKIDQAYLELTQASLMEPAKEVTLLGDRRQLFRVTEEGQRLGKELAA